MKFQMFQLYEPTKTLKQMISNFKTLSLIALIVFNLIACENKESYKTPGDSESNINNAESPEIKDIKAELNLPKPEVKETHPSDSTQTVIKRIGSQTDQGT